MVFPEAGTFCYAFALLPNHVHLLLRTGLTPLSVAMVRLLTGYAVHFNRVHKRHGQPFQNRYKSIVCQEDTYPKEYYVRGMSGQFPGMAFRCAWLTVVAHPGSLPESRRVRSGIRPERSPA